MKSIFMTLATGMILWGSICKAEAGTIWGAEYFPNVELTTHEGKKVRFFDDLIKDRVVAINFIFTSCTNICPLETARLREVQKILGERVGRDIYMYSISIDPKNDTPKVLKNFAKKFGVGPGWLFLTGKEEEITLLREKLGLISDASEAKNLKDHNLSLIIGNQSTGQWMKVSPYENPYILATQMGDWLHNWARLSEGGGDYAEAPELRNISGGENLFRTRCAACHTGQKPMGPDLQGIVRKRPKAWLTRWLLEPDKMLAEKDPVAMALLAEHDNVPMPNLRLNPKEIEALLAYLETL